MSTQVIDELKQRQHQQLLAHQRALVARESDKMADSARDLAGQMAAVTKLELGQVRNVETLAASTDKVSDILDLLKKLIGRDGRGERWAQNGVGQMLLSKLEGLRDDAKKIADQLRIYDKVFDEDLPRRIQLQLCREYLRHVTAHFEYLRREKEQPYQEVS